MPFKVKVITPETSGTITVKVERPKNSTCTHFEIDPIDEVPRYFIAFYTPGDISTGTETDTYRTGVEYDTSMYESSSFTALVVVKDKVVVRDRKMVRNGRTGQGAQ